MSREEAKKRKKLIKINPKINIVNFLPRATYYLGNLLKYRKKYFFDSSVLVCKDNEVDNRGVELDKLNKNLYITDIVKKEISNLLKNNNYKKILNKNFYVTNFESLRKKNPEVCLLYYNYITAMYNPANITSHTFAFEQYFSHYVNSKTINEELRKAHVVFMNKVIKSSKETYNIFKERKSVFEEYINIAFLKDFKKRKREFKKNKNFFNDYKNLSLILIYCLTNRANITFFTAEYDSITKILNWVDSIVQEMTFKNFIINRLGADGILKIANGKYQVNYDLNTLEFIKLNNNLLADFLNRDWKGSGFYFKIKLWDNKKKGFFQVLHLNFNELLRESLMKCHGQLSCPFVKNDTHANFFNYLYLWPPKNIKDFRYIKLNVTPKRIINSHYIKDSEEEHNILCRYRQQDINNKLYNLTGFYRGNNKQLIKEVFHK